MLALISSISLTSCIIKTDDDEPVIIVPPEQPAPSTLIPDDIASIEVDYNGGQIIRLNNTNIFSLITEYPNFKVESIFGNVVTPPRIIYLGKYDSLDEVPIQTEGQFKSDMAEIVDKGGYMVKLTSYRPTSGTQCNIYFKMWVNDQPGATPEKSKLKIDYAIYTKNV